MVITVCNLDVVILIISSKYCNFELCMPDRGVGFSFTVAYGIERINREVSLWMRGLTATDDGPGIPFLATRGYDSVVWNRLYSRDSSDLEDYQIEQASNSSENEALCYLIFCLLIIVHFQISLSCSFFR